MRVEPACNPLTVKNFTSALLIWALWRLILLQPEFTSPIRLAGHNKEHLSKSIWDAIYINAIMMPITIPITTLIRFRRAKKRSLPGQGDGFFEDFSIRAYLMI
jgi:hypothetical protein